MLFRHRIVQPGEVLSLAHLVAHAGQVLFVAEGVRHRLVQAGRAHGDTDALAPPLFPGESAYTLPPARASRLDAIHAPDPHDLFH